MSLAQYTIVMWYGALAAIPAGWQLCDGTGGTPDLRGYFVKGTAAGLAGDNTAHGSLSHTHTGVTDVVTSIATAAGTTAYRAPGHGHNLETDTASNEPPYKHLVFIMKS